MKEGVSLAAPLLRGPAQAGMIRLWRGHGGSPMDALRRPTAPAYAGMTSVIVPVFSAQVHNTPWIQRSNAT